MAVAAAALETWKGLSYADKLNTVNAAVGAIGSAGSSWWTFGLGNEGGGCRNEIHVKNHHSTLYFRGYYIHWGKVRTPPNPRIDVDDGDVCLYHNAGSWAATGSSGVLG